MFHVEHNEHLSERSGTHKQLSHAFRLENNPQMFHVEHLWKSYSNCVPLSLISMECPSDYAALKSGIANAQSMSIFWRSSLGFS
jgi:hypothetical protein